MDRHGWVSISDIIQNTDLTIEEINDIVATNNKNRFEMNGSHIRARQGHTIPGIEVEMEIRIPPEFLYHGTPIENVEKIKQSGLMKMSRLFVHLSGDQQTARIVGSRKRTKCEVLKINAKKMHEDGFTFHISSNGVWQVDSVPVQYILFR